jgi:hypothetical protein
MPQTGDTSNDAASLDRVRAMGLVAWLALIACIVCTAWNLTTSSLWIDELYTLHFTDAQLPFSELFFERLTTDTHPPLYYLFIHGWQLVFGSGDAALRLFSLLAAMATIGLFYLLGKRLFGPSAVVLALFVASSQLSFWVAVDARSYSTVIFFTSSLTLLTADWVNETGLRAWSWTRLGLFSLLGVLASLTHYYGLLLFASLFLATFVLEWTGPAGQTLRLRERVRLASRLLLAGGLALVCSLGYLCWHWPRLPGPEATAWIRSDPAFLIGHLRDLLIKTLGSESFLLVLSLLPLALTLRWIPAIHADPQTPRRPPEQLRSVWLLGLTLAIFVSVSVASSIFLRPTLSSRNLSIAAPALWLLAALLARGVVQRLRDGLGVAPRYLRSLARGYLPALGAVFVVLRCLSVANSFYPQREEWRASARELAAAELCQGQKVGIVGRLSFYMHYFDDPSRYRWVELDREELRSADGVVRLAEWRRVLPADERCPAVLWSVHNLKAEHIERVVSDLESSGIEVLHEAFWHYDVQSFTKLRKSRAFILVVQ